MALDHHDAVQLGECLGCGSVDSANQQSIDDRELEVNLMPEQSECVPVGVGDGTLVRETDVDWAGCDLESWTPLRSASSDVHDHHGPGLAQVTGACAGTRAVCPSSINCKPCLSSVITVGGAMLPARGITRKAHRSALSTLASSEHANCA